MINMLSYYFSQISSASMVSFLPYSQCGALYIYVACIFLAALSMVFSTVLMMVDFIIPCVTSKKVAN